MLNSMNRIAVTSFFAVCALLSGCASVTPKAYTATSVPIKKVLVVTQAQPPSVTVGIAGSMGMMFGGVGAAIAAANAGSQVRSFDDLFTSQGLNYHQRLQQQIMASLKDAGIEAEPVPVARERPNDFLVDYRPLLAQRGADAVLDVVVMEASYGGTHPMLDRKPRPILKVRARLVGSAASQDPLYAESISFGYSNPFESATELKSPSKFYFDDMEAVGADRQRAADGLRLAVDDVAKHISNQLRQTKNPTVTAGK
jgi:hypothetical protein